MRRKQTGEALRLDADFLKTVFKGGGYVDASARVLGETDKTGKPAPIEYSRSPTGVHRPPLLVAGAAFDAHGAIPQKPVDGADKRRLALRQFERLSLAARVGMLTGRLSHDWAEKREDPEHSRLLAAAEADGIRLEHMPTIEPEEILKALAWATDALTPNGRKGEKGSQPLAMRGGLQLIGVRIASRDPKSDGLNLVNARLPFSLRLVGCLIECPVLLPHCDLMSLDLSGSALDALDGTGLIAAGSVYLRRALVRTPVSFAGARIAGTFNASDVVIAPFTSLPSQMPVDPDNGILNLSRARIESDVRLSRARIWGGISLRGARVGRSLFMEEAVLVSPLALLEKSLSKAAPATDEDPAPSTTQLVGRCLSRIDEVMARRLFTPWAVNGERPAADSNLVAMEVLEHFTRRWPMLGKRTFRQLPLRALMTAVRADGLEVHGTIFARRIICNGKWRMKYAVIDGAIRMDDSLFRCPAEIRGNPDISEHLEWTLGRFPQARWLEEGYDVALDLRETTSRGDLSLGWEKDSPSRRPAATPDPEGKGHRWTGIEDRAAWAHCDIFGRVRMDGFTTQATIRFRNAVFHPLSFPPPSRTDEMEATLAQRAGTGNKSAPPDRPKVGPITRTLKAVFMRGRASSWTASRLLDAIVRVAWTPVRRSGKELRLRWNKVRPKDLPGQPAFADSPWRKMFKAAVDRAPDLDMTQVTTGRDVDLRGAVDINGVSLENAEIGGDLRFSHKAETGPFATHVYGWVPCMGRARNLHGHLNLQSIEVAGDAFLVFDARRGPSISAAMMKVDGRLEIYPQIDGQNYQFSESALKFKVTAECDEPGWPLNRAATDFWKGNDQIGFRQDRCSHEHTVESPNSSVPPGQYCKACGVMVDKIEDNLAWTIDLRSARATIFAHPPAAWPDPGGLRLEGFNYQQSSDIGPLAPPPPFSDDDDERADVRQLRYQWRRRPVWRPLLSLIIGVLLAAIGGTATWVVWRSTTALIGGLDGQGLFGWRHPLIGTGMLLVSALILQLCMTSRSKPGPTLLLLAVVGGLAIMGLLLAITEPLTPVPSLIAVCSLLVVVVAAANISMTLNPGKGLFSGKFEANPLGLEYLERQRVSENRFKLRPSGYPVLESYTRAARALRESGRYISANMIEEERLRKRTQMLSWRHHGAAKLLLSAVDLFAGYGFRLSRALSVLALTVCIVAVGAHWAAANGYLVAIASTETSTATLARAVSDRAPAGGPGSGMIVSRERDRADAPRPGYPTKVTTPARVIEPNRCGWSAGADSLGQDCPDLVYAADLLLPFIDLGEEKRWTAEIPVRAADSIVEIHEPFQSLWVSLLRSWPALINALGLLLSAIMVTAVAARVESAFARVEE